MINMSIIKMLFSLIIVLFAAIYFPKVYWDTFKFKVNRPRISYSPIINDILISTSNPDNAQIKDRKGKKYTRDEYEQLMPHFNFAQLVFAGKMPDSINGIEVNVPLLRNNIFQISFEPYRIDSYGLVLYPLIESEPGRVNLEFPYEFFVIDNRMDIYDSKSNKKKEAMSAEFTAALNDNGFKFPAKKLFGNPTTRKPFDDGYFVLDDQDQFFHVKRIKGKPYCRKIQIPSGMKIVHFSIQEMLLKEFHGFFVTENDELYLISYDDYKIINLPVKDYNYKSSSIRILGDLFYRTVSVINDDKISVFIFDRQYKQLDSYEEFLKSKDESVQGIIAAYVFPFSVELLSDNSMFIDFYFQFSNWRFLITNVLLALGVFTFLRFKKSSPSRNWFPLLLILLVGVYGLLAVFMIRDFDRNSTIGGHE